VCARVPQCVKGVQVVHRRNTLQRVDVLGRTATEAIAGLVQPMQPCCDKAHSDDPSSHPGSLPMQLQELLDAASDGDVIHLPLVADPRAVAWPLTPPSPHPQADNPASTPLLDPQADPPSTRHSEEPQGVGGLWGCRGARETGVTIVYRIGR
jgi:hypothetical protein